VPPELHSRFQEFYHPILCNFLSVRKLYLAEKLTGKRRVEGSARRQEF